MSYILYVNDEWMCHSGNLQFVQNHPVRSWDKGFILPIKSL